MVNSNNFIKNYKQLLTLGKYYFYTPWKKKEIKICKTLTSIPKEKLILQS